MFKKLLLHTLIHILFFTLNTHALYVFDKDPDQPVNPLKFTNKNTPCKNIVAIMTPYAQSTGTLIAPNKILTTRSAVENKHIFPKTFAAPEKICVVIDKKKYDVVSMNIFGKLEIDLALLTLKQEVKDIPPRQINTVQQNEKINLATMTGSGSGRVLLDWSRSGPAYPALDKVQHDFNLLFRLEELTHKIEFFYREHRVHPQAKVQQDAGGEPVIDIASDYIILSQGDIGAPLLDHQHKIIGIATDGDRAFFEREEKAELAIWTLFDRQYRKFFNQLIVGDIPFITFVGTSFASAYSFFKYGLNSHLTAGLMISTVVLSRALSYHLEKQRDKELTPYADFWVRTLFRDSYTHISKELDIYVHNRYLKHHRLINEDGLAGIPFRAKYLAITNEIQAWIDGVLKS